MTLVLLKNENNASCGIDQSGHKEVLETSPLLFLHQRCLQHGSTIEGRKEAFRQLLGVRQKPAVLVSELTGELWFPTESDANQTCIWLRYDCILDIRSAGSDNTEVTFTSGWRTMIPYDLRTIRKQMNRCAEFLHRIDQSVINSSIAEGVKDLLANRDYDTETEH